MMVRLTFLAAACWFCAAGCQRGPYGPRGAEGLPSPHEFSNRVTMYDPHVRDALHYVDSKAERLPTGRAAAWVQMRSTCGTETLWADVRFVFFADAQTEAGPEQGREIVDATAWQSVAFPSWELVQVAEQSLKPGVTSCNVQVRNLRSAHGGCCWRRYEWHLPVWEDFYDDPVDIPADLQVAHEG